MSLTPQEEAKVREVFDAIDTDGTGEISSENLQDALTNAGFNLTDEEVEAVIGLVDADGTGTITWDNFISVVEQRPIKRRIEAALRRLFDAFDTDGSGFITSGDLRNLIDEAGFGDEVSDDQLEEIISALDDAGDGKVSFEEFLGAFMG